MNSDRIWTLLARKLAGEASPEELAEIEVLLKEDPYTHPKIQSITESWNEKDNTGEEDPEPAYQRVTAKLQEQGLLALHDEAESQTGFINPRSRFFGIKPVAFMVFIAVAITVGLYSWLELGGNKGPALLVSDNLLNTISTKYGSRSKVELPDGSVVWLNSGSKLTYDKEFGATLREVNLSGEGFFDVVHNAEKPFIIHTAFFDIKDLGTQFNVKCYPEDKITETSLVEGSVEITVKKRPNEKYVLKPDEKLVLFNPEINNDSIKAFTGKKINHLSVEPLIAIKKMTYLAEDSFSVETAWTYNKLSFDDEAFSEVAKKMERWYNRDIEFRNPMLEEMHLNGSFINESLEQAMDALKYTAHFKYEIKNDKVIIY